MLQGTENEDQRVQHQVTTCYENRAGRLHRNRPGADKGEEITEAATYHMVVKMEYIDKQVIFE